jgi:drug/metabolite transporter (DMT)-like permease
MSPSRIRLLTAFALVYVIWGSTYLGIRFAIETIPPFLMAGMRFLIAGGILYASVMLRGARAPTRRQWVAASIIGALLLLCGNGAVVWAELRVPSGLVALMVATEPLCVVILDWARPRGQRPRAGELIGLLLGFAGVAILVSPVALVGAGLDIDPIGAVVVFVAVVSWAVGSIYSRHAPAHESAFLMTGMKMLAGGFFLLLAATVAGEWSRLDIGAISTKSWLAFGYLTVAGALVGFTAYIWLLKNTTLARASTYAYVNPIVALLLGWWLANEPMNGRVVVAAAVIVAGVVIVVRSHASPVADEVS